MHAASMPICSIQFFLVIHGAMSSGNMPIRGTNYGGRFIPEHWMALPGMAPLYDNVTSGGQCQPHACVLSLCDLASDPESGSRMLQYLNDSIRLEHFERIARDGFTFIRLPLGYWNFVQPDDAPDAPASTAARWLAIERMLRPADYAPHIARVLEHARSHNLSVLLDLHGAPGGQSVNQCTGCATACEGDGCDHSAHYFNSPRNRAVAVDAITQMARLCQASRPTCFGIELLNEPEENTPRADLLSFYKHAIRAARGPGGLDVSVPIVVMDWVDKLAEFWTGHAKTLSVNAGALVFETHVRARPSHYD